MDSSSLDKALETLAKGQQELADVATSLSGQVHQLVIQGQAPIVADHSFFVTGLTVFILACFVGYYVVWRVTPALHSPLMAVTNAVSSVIIVGAIFAAGSVDMTSAKMMGLAAVLLASVNIFGGFIVTQRMLQMFKKKGQ